MLRYCVVAISPTYATLYGSDYAKDFTPKSTEYIIVALDENFRQVGKPDYGYTSRRRVERLVTRLNKHERHGQATR